jgi:ADP-heptose:LPS heptosyltransferase
MIPIQSKSSGNTAAPVVLISRTDKIGDVVLTLPMAGFIKRLLPEAKVVFLGQAYTRPIIESSQHVDTFIDWKELETQPLKNQIQLLKELGVTIFIHVFPNKKIASLAKQAAISMRIGTNRRIYHWWTCTHRVPLSRRYSLLHEAQLNSLLLGPVMGSGAPTPEDLAGLYGLSARSHLSADLEAILAKSKFRLVLHPRSRGSAREWPMTHYIKLIELLEHQDMDFFITGTDAEAAEIHAALATLPSRLESRVHNLAGKLRLTELMSLLARANGFVGASTGPLHIAAALGVRTLGIYPSISPMDSRRWGPLGKRAKAISAKAPGECNACRNADVCPCMEKVTAEIVAAEIGNWIANETSTTASVD